MTVPNFADKTIWTGNNLDIMRGMNSECVELIYLDPPFNFNREYAAPVGSVVSGAAFKDTWRCGTVNANLKRVERTARPTFTNWELSRRRAKHAGEYQRLRNKL